MEFDKIINLLLIEDETYDVNRIKRTLEPFNDKIQIKKIVSDGLSAIELLSDNNDEFDVVIMDYQIVGPLTGEKLIRRIKLIDPFIQIIVITKMTINVTNFELANDLIEAGAMWFCTKYPSDIKDYIYQPTDLLLSIMNAYEKKKLNLEKSRTNQQLDKSIDKIIAQKPLIGNSAPIKKLQKQIEKASQQDVTVLISGASGTGKELVATHIHYLSKRKFENFVTINAGSIPQNLIESELFGFEKGSFTGANSSKKGLFEQANNGTLFMDEIGELPTNSQVKLLRVLQEGEIDKIGRTEKIKVNVRIISATNQDLEKAVENKTFRSDLFYRLNVIYIYTPTLLERIEDIPDLAVHFISQFSKQMSIPKPGLSKDALDVLQNYNWPGNIRQFQNVIQRALLTAEDEITKDDLLGVMKMEKHSGSVDGPKFSFGDKILEWKEMETIFRWRYFNHVMDKTKNEAEAARLLGFAPSNFYRMLGKMGFK